MPVPKATIEFIADEQVWTSYGYNNVEFKKKIEFISNWISRNLSSQCCEGMVIDTYKRKKMG